MTFRELELIAFLSASLVHGSQVVLLGRHLRATQGREWAEARQGLLSLGLCFAWQFSNFACGLLATVGLGYPSLPSKLGNLVSWGTLHAFPVMFSYQVTTLQPCGRPPHWRPVKAVKALRYLLWLWMLVGLSSLIAEGTGLFTSPVHFRVAAQITLTLMLVFFVVFTIQGLQLERDGLSSPLVRVRRAGLVASGASAVLMALFLSSAFVTFAELGKYLGLAAMMGTVPFSIYLAYRYYQFSFMDVFIREAVTGLALVMGFVVAVAASSLLPSGLQVLWLVALALALAFAKEPLSREVERRLLGYQETIEQQEERLGNALRGLTEQESFRAQAESVLERELEAEWVAIDVEPRPNALHRFELKSSAPEWLSLGPRIGKRPYMSRQLRLARFAALLLAAQQEWLRGRDNERRRLIEQHQLRELTARAEIRALQAQINPHFLFNTLNVLANLIQDNPQRAERVTEQLAEVFRYVLESTRCQWVSLEEEVRFLQAYLDIETARFGERLRHHWIDWIRRPAGDLSGTRTLPNQITFGASIKPGPKRVGMELWLRNNSNEVISGVRTQICVMLGRASEFAAQTNDNKVFRTPICAVKSSQSERWVLTAWEGSRRTWGNAACPCMHADPVFPDCRPGQTVRRKGWLWFFEGEDIEYEFRRAKKAFVSVIE